MDGLHKLIEMLEKRFGKRAADILLLTSIGGAAAWGIHAMATYLVLPAVRYCVPVVENILKVDDKTLNNTLLNWIAAGLGTLVVMWPVMIAFDLYSKAVLKKMRKALADVEQEISEIRINVDAASKHEAALMSMIIALESQNNPSAPD